MLKKLVASTLVVIIIATTNVAVYADKETDNPANLIKIEQTLNTNDDSTDDTKSTNEKESWIHMITPKISVKDKTVISDGELVISLNIDSDENVYFILAKVQDTAGEEIKTESKLSEEEKFIVYSLAVNKKIKTESNSENVVIDNELRVVNAEINEEATDNATNEDSALEENPEGTVKSDDNREELVGIYSETIEPNDVLETDFVKAFKDMTPGVYRLLFFKESFYNEIVKLGDSNNNKDQVININANEKKFESIEFTIKPSKNVLEEALDSNSTDILLGE